MKFCVTTPIYYINGDPHIGHVYTSTAADILSRFKRLDGFDVHFSTGTDEHGIKVARSAEFAKINIEKFSDVMSQKFRDITELSNISCDDFIRTTEERHKLSAQTLWSRMSADIYEGAYSGWYSARDEEYVALGDIVDGKAPNGSPVEWVEEVSYFFKLSAYQDKLLALYNDNPDFISPVSRKNEVISFVKGGLRDLSISRSKFNWGVPVPNDESSKHEHVMYVWVDALANYLTTLGFPNDKKNTLEEYMQNCIHVVGKEILRFHAVYWPAFLMSAGFPLPKKVFAHGWWTNEGKKMSKSIGNVVEPESIIQKYGLDALRYFMFREVRFGEDGDFSESSLKNRIMYDLANDLGNLIQRVLAFIQKRGGYLNVSYELSDYDKSLFENSRTMIEKMRPLIDKQDLSTALSVVWDLVSQSNKYVNDMRPWELAKKDISRLNTVLTVLCESIRAIGFGLLPFMPDIAKKILDFVNAEGKSFSELSVDIVDQQLKKPSVLFPKEKFVLDE